MLARRSWLLFGLALSAAPLWAADGRATWVLENDVDVDYRNGVYLANLSFKVPVKTVIVLDVLTDFEHMALFVPNLTQSHIVERVGKSYRVVQDGKARFGPFNVDFHSLRKIDVLPDGRLVSDSLPGSSSRSHSEMKVQALADGWTKLDYQLELEPSAWIPSSLGVGFLRHELIEQFEAMAREMLRRQQGAKR